jgi:hypothetical protein
LSPQFIICYFYFNPFLHPSYNAQRQEKINLSKTKK